MCRVQRFALRVVVTALTVLLASHYISDLQVDDLTSALLFAFVLGLLNAFLRPIILLLTLPLTVLTLGLFTLVINALVFWLAALLPVGVHATFSAAFLGALIVSVVSFFASRLIR